MKRLVVIIFLMSLGWVAFGQAPTIQWQKSLGGSGVEKAYYIKQTNDGGYIVAGYTTSNDGDITSSHGGNDFWIAKLGNVTGIEESNSSTSLTLSPNPTSGIFQLTTTNQQLQIIKVHNVLGEMVLQQTVDNVSTSSTSCKQQTTINISGQPKGIYFVQIQTNGSANSPIVENRKIIIQ